MKYAFSIVACVALTSCVGKPVQEMSYTERRELAGQLVKRCMDQGVKLKTPEMEQCTKQEALREVTTRNNAPRWRFNPAGAGTALRGVSQGYYRAAAASPANTSVTCSNVPSPAGYSSVRCR